MTSCHEEPKPQSNGTTEPSAAWWNQLRFDNISQKHLGIANQEDLDGRDVTGVGFVAAWPTVLANPETVCLSEDVLSFLGGHGGMSITADQLCGNELPASASPAAHCYCGHQLGTFAGQLGDGAAITLGEVVALSGQKLDLQLKGAGPTHFTRKDAGTGRKNVGPMVREMLVAEALAAIGVATTRALAVVAGEDATNMGSQLCAVLVRTASSFLRVGSFETTLTADLHPSSGNHAPSAGDVRFLRRLADHCISLHFTHVADIPEEQDEEDDDLRVAPRYHGLVLEVTRSTARLVAAWQCLGAVHGMLNTDNVSAVGLTMDHGSFSFMEHTYGEFKSASADRGGRYSFSQQPSAARWACQRLALALQLLHCTMPQEMDAEVTEAFDITFTEAYNHGMRQKLGLRSSAPVLVKDLVTIMERSGADWTCTFRVLVSPGSPETLAADLSQWCKSSCSSTTKDWEAWIHRYAEALVVEGDDITSTVRRDLAASSNPVVVPRRWLLDKAASAAEDGDYAEVRRIFAVVTQPFTEPMDASLAQPLSMT